MSLWARRIRDTTLVGVFLLALVFVICPGRAFDPEVWHDESRRLDRSRNAMADRMIAHGTLIGKTRDQVIEMLGPPVDREGFDRDFHSKLVYQLGPSRSLLSVDYEWLTIQLGPDGRVAECWLWED